MLYVAMTRGRRNSEAYLYQLLAHEADHEHAKPVAAPAIHQTRRGNKHSAAYYFRQILGNDDRPRTMHAEAETHRASLASRGGRRGDSTPRGTPPRPPRRVAGLREDGAGVASRSRAHGRRGRDPRRRRTGAVNLRRRLNIELVTETVGLQRVRFRGSSTSKAQVRDVIQRSKLRDAHRCPTCTSERDVNERGPSASVRVNPSDGSCGRMANTARA
jgi:hypothetical protein